MMSDSNPQGPGTATVRLSRLVTAAAAAILTAWLSDPLLARAGLLSDVLPLLPAALAAVTAWRLPTGSAEEEKRRLRASCLAALALLSVCTWHLSLPLLNSRLDLQIEGLGERSGGVSTEVWLMAAEHADGVPVALKDFHASSGWQRLYSSWVFTGTQPGILSWRGRAQALTLHFHQHPWSGLVRITSSALAQPVTVDLYNAADDNVVVQVGQAATSSVLAPLLIYGALGVLLVRAAAALRRRRTWVPPGLERVWSRAEPVLMVAIPLLAWLLANAITPYPSISPDSIGQYMQAVRQGASILPALEPPYKPPFMTLVMAPFVQAFGVKGYMLFHSGLFFAAITLFYRRLLPAGGGRLLVLAATCWHPAIMVMAMTLWVDILEAALLLLAIAEGLVFARTRRTLPLATALLLLYFALSARFNALTIMPVVAVAGLVFLWRDRRQQTGGGRLNLRLVAALLLLIGMVPAIGLWNHHPKVVATVSTLPVGIINQYVGTLRQAALDGKTSDPVYQRQKHLADENFGPGSLERLFESFKIIPDYREWLYKEDFLGMRKAVLSGGFMVEQLPRVVIAFPGEFLDYKLRYSSGILFGTRLTFCLNACFFAITPEQEAALRLPADRTPPAALAGLADRIRHLDKPLSASRHIAVWNMLLWCVLFALVGLVIGDGVMAFVAGLGLFYSVGFFVVDIGPEWRYFLFTFLCFTGCAARILLRALRPAEDGNGAPENTPSPSRG